MAAPVQSFPSQNLIYSEKKNAKTISDTPNLQLKPGTLWKNGANTLTRASPVWIIISREQNFHGTAAVFY